MEPGEEPLDFPAAVRRRSGRPSCVAGGDDWHGAARSFRCRTSSPAVIERIAVVALSPIRRAGNRVRNDASSVASTSVTSCGEALATWTARGRPWPSQIAMILLPLPRRVGPTAEPLFSPS